MSEYLKGKRGLIMGVANERSIAWGIAKAMAGAGAELAFTYQGEAFGTRLKPLAESVGSDFMVDVDVTDDASLDAAFDQLGARWPTIDFVVHAIAFSDKSELTGRFLNTSRANFKHSLDISAYSFIEIARRAHPLMVENGGTLLTLTYQGSNKVVPNYNVMGVAKAALESATRYLANDLGPEGIRVNAINPVAGDTPLLQSFMGEDTPEIRAKFISTIPLGRFSTPEDMGNAACFLCSDEASMITGVAMEVDGGRCI
jgi:enoyl-[acyl-carrier protein] reductase I